MTIDNQEAFLDTLIDELKIMNQYLRSEELYDDIDDIIYDVNEKMKEIKETLINQILYKNHLTL